MALKGKKKARKRGSQARRRPAAPPRPTYGGREKKRWYQTTSGLVLAFILIATVAILTIWFVASSRSEKQELQTTQDALNGFTSNVRAVGQDIDPIVGELSGASALADDELVEKTKAWKKELATAHSTLSQALPPESATTAHSLMLQAILMYSQAADQYALLPEVDKDARERLSGAAASTVSAANNVFTQAITIIDEARADAELSASGLTPPGAGPGATSEDTIEIPAETP